MAAPVTEAAITKIRDLINSGQIGPVAATSAGKGSRRRRAAAG